MPVNGNCCGGVLGMGYIFTLSGLVANCRDGSYKHNQSDIDDINDLTIYMPSLTSGANASSNTCRSARVYLYPGTTWTENQFLTGGCPGTPDFVSSSSTGFFEFRVNINSFSMGPFLLMTQFTASGSRISTVSTFTPISQVLTNESTANGTGWAVNGQLTMRAVGGSVTLSPGTITLSGIAQTSTLTITAVPGSNGNAEWVAAPSNSNGTVYAGAARSLGTGSSSHITLTNSYGNGNGTVVFTVTANGTGATRQGFINVNGSLCTVNQTI